MHFIAISFVILAEVTVWSPKRVVWACFLNQVFEDITFRLLFPKPVIKALCFTWTRSKFLVTHYDLQTSSIQAKNYLVIESRCTKPLASLSQCKESCWNVEVNRPWSCEADWFKLVCLIQTRTMQLALSQLRWMLLPAVAVVMTVICLRDKLFCEISEIQRMLHTSTFSFPQQWSFTLFWVCATVVLE